MTESLVLSCSFLWDLCKPTSRHFNFETSTWHFTSFREEKTIKRCQMVGKNVKNCGPWDDEVDMVNRSGKDHLFFSHSPGYTTHWWGENLLFSLKEFWTLERQKHSPSKSSLFKIIFMASNSSSFQDGQSKILSVTANLTSSGNSNSWVSLGGGTFV